MEPVDTPLPCVDYHKGLPCPLYLGMLRHFYSQVADRSI